MSVARLLAYALVATTLQLPSTRAIAEPLSPFSEFMNLTEQQLWTVQGKLTDLGFHTRSMYTLAFGATGSAMDLGVFTPYYRPTYAGRYALDSGKPASFTMSPGMIDALLDSLATLPSVTDGGEDGLMSFALTVVKNDVRLVFESLIDTSDMRPVLGRMLAAVQDDSVAAETITSFACHRGFLPGARIADVTLSTQLRFGGFRKDRRSGNYVCKVRLSNIGSISLAAPLLVAFRPPDYVTLLTGSGFTCASEPSGAPYQIVLSDGSLGVGSHVDALLRFSNPDDVQVELLMPRVFSGPGFR